MFTSHDETVAAVIPAWVYPVAITGAHRMAIP